MIVSIFRFLRERDALREKILTYVFSNRARRLNPRALDRILDVAMMLVDTCMGNETG